MKNNIARTFIDYMEDLGLGTFGDDIFIGAAPQDAPDEVWWVLASGGNPQSENKTGERIKKYTLEVYYRSSDPEDVYNILQTLEEDINRKGCVDLSGYDVINMETLTFPTDRDLDGEDRSIGMIQVTISVYQGDESVS